MAKASKKANRFQNNGIPSSQVETKEKVIISPLFQQITGVVFDKEKMKERTVEIDTKEAWAVVEFEINGETVTVHEGSQIEFVTESGENVVGQVVKITGKGEKTKLQIMPIGADCEQIWKVVNIKTLKVKD